MRQELLEVSAVPVPANPEALARAMANGLEIPRLGSLFALGEPQVSEELDDVRADAVVEALRRLRGAA